MEDIGAVLFRKPIRRNLLYFSTVSFITIGETDLPIVYIVSEKFVILWTYPFLARNVSSLIQSSLTGLPEMLHTFARDCTSYGLIISNPRNV